MKNVLIIGAGGVGSAVTHKCAQHNDELGDVQAGDSVTVYYDQHDPQSSVLFCVADFTTNFLMTWCSMVMVGWCVMIEG